MSLRILALLLLSAVTQEKGMSQLIEELGDGNVAVRDRASRDLVDGWKRWSVEELEALADSRREDPETVARSRDALARIRIRQAIGESLLNAIPGLEAACLGRNEELLLQALDRAEQLHRKSGVDGADLVSLLRWISERKWSDRVGERVAELEKRGVIADPKLVLPLLKEEDPTRRMRALDTLARLRATGLAAEIVPLLTDPKPDVRHEAARALTMLNARDQVDKILPLLEKGPDVRHWAVILLGNLAAREAAPRLLPLLRHSDPHLRQVVVASLAKMRARDMAKDLVLLLADPIPGVRRQAVEALGTLEADEAVPAIESLLGSKEAATRAAASEALAELRAGSAALAPLLKDPELPVRVAAIQAIGRSGDRSSTPALRALLAEGDVWIVANVLDALGRLGGPAEAEAVVPLLRSESPLLREKALDALGRLGAVGSLKADAGVLQDKVPAVRAAALGALTRLGSPDLLPAARLLLSDDDASVREQALMALVDVGDPGSARDVRPLIRDESARVRIQAAEALSTVGSAEDLAELLPLLDDPAPWVRARVGPMIARIGMRTTKVAGREPLIRVLRIAEREPDKEVSEGAAIGLLLLGGLERKGERSLVQRFRSPGMTSDSRLVLDLLDALNATHERDAFERYSRRSTAASSIESGEALGRFAESVGIKLRPGIPLKFSGRSPEGAQTSLHDLVRRHVHPRAPVLVGGTLTLTSLHGALAEWERRLQD